MGPPMQMKPTEVSRPDEGAMPASLKEKNGKWK